MTIPVLRHVPGWVGTFLFQIKQGKSEKVAANIAGIGTAVVKQTVERDPKFKAEYQDAWDRRKQPITGG